ncbi:hypothetical protein [Pseudoalteromonas rubra]|nr:hypothetical protein [Pseudoalteromonas rubra]
MEIMIVASLLLTYKITEVVCVLKKFTSKKSFFVGSVTTFLVFNLVSYLVLSNREYDEPYLEVIVFLISIASAVMVGIKCYVAASENDY